MSYTLSPSTLAATSEGTQVNQTVTITVGTFDPPISSIAVYKLEHTQGNIDVSIGASSFTLNGQYLQNWDQTILYEEFGTNGNANVTVNQFSKVSSNLNFIISYIANTAPATLTANYAISINGEANIFLTQPVKTGFTPNQESLIAAVAKGKF
jgi:hypothetical protein